MNPITNLDNMINQYTNDLNKDSHLFHKLNNMKKQHKELTALIHIYKHKVNNYVEPQYEKLKNIINDTQLPGIINSENNTRKEKVIKRVFSKPKFSLEDEKQKLLRVKENIQMNKEKKQKEAKDMKEANRIMRENVMLFKDQVHEENKQKKRIIDAKYELMKNSISNYQILKKCFTHSIIKEKVEIEMKLIYKKQNELKELKGKHDLNLRKMKRSKKESKKGNEGENNPNIHNKEDNFNSNNFEKFMMKVEMQDNTFLTDVNHKDI